MKRNARTGRAVLALIALAVSTLAVPALSVAGKNTVEVESKLRGKNEIPGPGDRNGKGELQVFLKAKKEKICFSLELSKLDLVTAGHIHKGTADEAGKVKVGLFEDPAGIEGTGSYEGCVKGVKGKLVRKIGDVPEKFYVNIHTVDYPDGAIRGQLGPTEGVG